MTVALYARRKGWPLQHVKVWLRHDRIHAVDCVECETKEGRLDQVRWSLQLSGALTVEQRDKLLEISQKCPVHRTLRSEVRILPPSLVDAATP
jgi:putative redox protein